MREFNPVPEDDTLSLEAQREEIAQRRLLNEAGSEYLFGIFRSGANALIGRVGLHRVTRGPFQNAILGYHLDASEAGKGIATDAVRLAVDFAFETLRLHRVEAGVMPSNVASVRVLEKNGFRWEGIADGLIRVRDVWEDHWMFALTREEWPPPRPAAHPRPYFIRRANEDDVESLVELRIALLVEYARAPENDNEDLRDATRRFLIDGLRGGDFVGWVAESDGRVVSTAGMIYVRKPPSADNLGGLETYVMNVYTVPAWRGAGIATALMRTVLDFVRDETAAGRVRLHSAERARPIYRKLGFDPINYEMRLVVERP